MYCCSTNPLPSLTGSDFSSSPDHCGFPGMVSVLEMTLQSLQCWITASALLGLLMPFTLVANEEVHASVRTYMLVIPATLNYPSSQSVCVQCSGVRWPFHLNVQLQTKSGTRQILNMEINPGRLLGCTRFKVPAPSGGSEEVAQVLVQGKGGIEPFEDSKTVLILQNQKGTFLQTDKPVYMAGQTVNFRVVTLDDDFRPVNDEYPLILVKDPNGNRIAQWVNMAPQQGIIDISFPLSSEPSLGIYIIQDGAGTLSATFTVEEYVLPRFEVNFVQPSFISALDHSINLQVCGRYTYGKPVRGTVNGALCQNAYHYTWFWGPQMTEDHCQNFEGETDRSGCFSAAISMSSFDLVQYWNYQPLNATATLTESGTGIAVDVSRSYDISFVSATATFQQVDTRYIDGAPFTGQIKVVDGARMPLPGHGVTLTANGVSTDYITDSNGIIAFSLDTSGWGDSYVNLQATIQRDNPTSQYKDAYLNISPFYSNVRSWLKIQAPRGSFSCGQTQNIQVNYKLDPNDMNPDKLMEFYYYITGRKGIIYEGITSLYIDEEGCGANTLQGSFNIAVTFNRLFAPSVQLLVFALFPNRGITADSIQLQVSLCFQNKVELAFSVLEDLPGSDVSVELNADPDSLCSLRAVDKSILLLKAETELSSKTVYDLFLGMDRVGYPYQVAESVSESCGFFWYTPPSVDVHSLFKEAGLKVFTNSQIQKPVNCNEQYEYPVPMMFALENAQPVMGVANMNAPATSVQDKVRQYFPETWIWDLVSVGPSGHQEIAVTLPDTITEWRAMSFCTSKAGFGLSPTVSLTTLKPFFVELTLPYSVVRREQFTLKATVFNFVDGCLKIEVHLAETQDFETVPCPDCQYTAFLSSNDSETFSWSVRASQLGTVNFTVTVQALDTQDLCEGHRTIVPQNGRMDTLIKPLLVRAEGVSRVRTYNFMLCPNGATVSEVALLVLPNDVIQGSQKASISVFGDILGSALENLDHLIQMPYGCGEQNMLNFAPLVYVLPYLEKTNQLTNDICQRANYYLQTGYQQELNFKHLDGSYSAFGESDSSGSTWLTAFVAKSFSQAQRFISVDDNVIASAVMWLQQRQSPEGCFENVGMLYHTSLKGGVDDDVSLSAYITSALLEIETSAQSPVVVNGLQCLKNKISNVTSVYTLALLFYTFALANDEAIWQDLVQKLEPMAIQSGGQKHWAYTPHSDNNNFWYAPEPADVETTAYVLLGYLSVADKSQINIAEFVPIVHWLSKQQNPCGGFLSTQDTVVALQALAKYAALMYSDNAAVTVTVTGANGFLKQYTVNEANRLLLQQEILMAIPEEYTVLAVGHGCVFVQMNLYYNIPVPTSGSSFYLIVMADFVLNMNSAGGALYISIQVSYIGSREKTNMVLIEVQLPSGFYPQDNVKKVLNGQNFVKRTEQSSGYVIIYLDHLDHEMQIYSFTAYQQLVVKDLQPSTVKVYDYYQPGEYAETQYKPTLQEPTPEPTIGTSTEPEPTPEPTIGTSTEPEPTPEPTIGTSTEPVTEEENTKAFNSTSP